MLNNSLPRKSIFKCCRESERVHDSMHRFTYSKLKSLYLSLNFLSVSLQSHMRKTVVRSPHSDLSRTCSLRTLLVVCTYQIPIYFQLSVVVVVKEARGFSPKAYPGQRPCFRGLEVMSRSALMYIVQSYRHSALR